MLKPSDNPIRCREVRAAAVTRCPQASTVRGSSKRVVRTTIDPMYPQAKANPQTTARIGVTTSPASVRVLELRFQIASQDRDDHQNHLLGEHEEPQTLVLRCEHEVTQCRQDVPSDHRYQHDGP